MKGEKRTDLRKNVKTDIIEKDLRRAAVRGRPKEKSTGRPRRFYRCRTVFCGVQQRRIRADKTGFSQALATVVFHQTTKLVLGIDRHAGAQRFYVAVRQKPG